MHDQMLYPSGAAESLRRKGDRLFAERRVAEALAAYDAAVKAGLDPTRCEGASWNCHMLLGQYRRAWRISDRVLAARVKAGPCWYWPRHQQWAWDGRPLAGKRVLVRCYHGLGDTIQLVRFMPALREIAREVIVWAQPALLAILATMPSIDQLLPLHDGVPDVEFDAEIELAEVMHVLRARLETLPADVPYLKVDPALVRARSLTLAKDRNLRVGLVWAAGDWDRRRSMPLYLLAPLDAVRGISLYALQRGPALAEAHEPGAPELVLLKDPSLDVLDTAAIIRNLDLVVSVDTMVAHLAGALGVPVWTLLPEAADWRWMLDRSDTPWYPTMQLFRQPVAGDWESVVARVADGLADLVRRQK